MKLVTLEYQEVDKKPHIVLFTRENHTRQKTVISDFSPYFYIPYQECELEVPELFDSLDGKIVAKHYTQTPGEVLEARKLFSKTYEADVRFTSRYLIDKIPKIEKADLRIHYTDIETDIKTNQIISIAVYDNYLEKAVCFVWKSGLKPEVKQETFSFPSGYQFKASVRLYNSKESMLRDYVKFVQETDPDILTGWFFLDFDMFYIINEINSIKGLSASWLSPLGKCYIKKENKDKKFVEDDKEVCQGRVLWDMLKWYAKLQPTGLPDKSLEAISQKELGEGKKSLDRSISWLWQNDLKSFVTYNAMDAVLVYRLDKKCKIIDHYDSRRRWLGCTWDTLHKSTFMWDTKILRSTNGVILPTKKRIEIGEVKGAEVFMPVSKGVHNNIILLDLKALYPSIIITFNMSPEMVSPDKNNTYNLNNGVSFKKEPIGLLPKILLEMVEERKKYKEEMKKYPFGTDEYDVYDHLQTSVKVMMNSLYGATISTGDKNITYSNFRLASREVGSSVTFMGRETIKRVRWKLEQLGFKVLYGDTDSVFYYSKKDNLKDIVEEMTNAVNNINEDLKTFVQESGGDSSHSYIQIEPKKIYKQFIMFKKKDKEGKPAKKKYGGRLMWNEEKEVDELDYMGIEARRSNSSDLTRQLQKKVLKVLLGFEPIENLKVYIGEARNNISCPEPDLDAIGISQGLSQDLKEYKTDNPWVRGSVWSNEYLGTNFGVGDRPKLIYVKGVPQGYPKTDVICFRNSRDIPKGFVVDSVKMFEKSVEKKLEQLLDASNLSFEEVFLGQSRLDRF